MSELKQVKVDNWGIYFLQRLKHFFNRTDYCDLTLQFQDNAQLKVHRLVLSACTEYFEVLERTCEMYEDCLVMPDDLQADVVVPIVNFMYTGQLEYRPDMLDKLHQTSEIMQMNVLTKLLESHKVTRVKRYPKINDTSKTTLLNISSTPNKRSYAKAFDKNTPKATKHYSSTICKVKPSLLTVENASMYVEKQISKKKLHNKTEPRPTRYELPEEFDTDNIFDNSFSNISYTSAPLMVHPDSTKYYSPKRNRLFDEPSSSRKFDGISTLDIVECKKVTPDNNLFDDGIPEDPDDPEAYQDSFINIRSDMQRDTSQLFDQILDQSHQNDMNGPKVTIEAKDKIASNLDHAKIISEVLKKYPHLVKSNKNIKLKILNTPTKALKKRKQIEEKSQMKIKTEPESDYTYETDVLDSIKAAKLIAMGAENVKGPWICLICGTPGRALHFTSYYKFRRHLVEVHNEKPVMNMCEYCGQKSLKRNYLLHHMYAKHGVPPPSSYHFPKCNQCDYIAISETLLAKHKLSHSKNFRCNACSLAFHSSHELLIHIQNTGHKFRSDRKSNLQCVYCSKVFLREGTLYTHLKTQHNQDARRHGIIDDSDDESKEEFIKPRKPEQVKIEVPVFDSSELSDDLQYQIQQRPDGNITFVPKKQSTPSQNQKYKILNTSFGPLKTEVPKTAKVARPLNEPQNQYLEDVIDLPSNEEHEEIVMIDNIEYIMKNNELIPKKSKQSVMNNEYDYTDLMDSNNEQTTIVETPQAVSMDYTSIQNSNDIQEPCEIIKKSTNVGQPIQIVVSNEEEYKALMNSNHPIIFDQNDSNKSLTVLTTPHTATLDTTGINLHNNQTNDMMIIQEGYPLNVSEAVATDSNIVVVYSHQLDGQNKQYQLITPQGLDPEFVQTSAIITQNYDTITTTSPVVSAHVLNTPVSQSWQHSMEQTIVNEPEQVEIQRIVQTTETPETDSADHLNDLSPVQLLSENDKDVDAVEPISQPQVLAPEPNHQEEIDQELNDKTFEDIQSESTASMVVDIPAQNEPILSQENVCQSQITEKQHDNDESNACKDQENLSTVDLVPDAREENNTTEIPACEIIYTEEQSLKPNEQEISDVTENEDIEVNNQDIISCEKQPDEKIQSLTSEWSDDEYETVGVDSTNTSMQVDENNTLSTTEIEESIENIQEEVSKQTAAMCKEPEEITVAEEFSIEKSTSEHANTVPVIVSNDVPQEKISSLLNDWEDTQEDVPYINENQSIAENKTEEETLEQEPVCSVQDATACAETENKIEMHESNDEKMESEPVVENVANIKNLVSDWDEEEEEENKKD